MKKITTTIIGVGILALQGCSGAMTPEDIASNESAVTSCGTNVGVFTTQAALAVAMAIELGRFDAVNDLRNTSTKDHPQVAANCTSCKMTLAILGQQAYTADQSSFSNTNYASTLASSFDRQKSMDTNLKLNYPTKVAVAHKLKKIAGPTNLGTGACGAHYVFQADHLDGTPLTATEASNLKERLCFFGMNSNSYGCGGNGWLSFMSGGVAGCPSGKQCIAIDPDGNDSGVAPNTSAGAIPQYPMNRFWDPNNTTFGKQCQKYNSNPAILGTMQSKCSSMPSTCGYEYCI